MTSITKFEVNGDINALNGQLGAVYNTSLVVPPATTINLWGLGSKPYNYYIIDSVNFINITMPEIGQSNVQARIGYNTTIINMSINNFIIRDFNNNIILELQSKKSVRLVALDLLQNWTFATTVLKPNLLPGTNLMINSVSDYEYSFKNLISSDLSLDIIDLSNQVDLKVKIPPNPINPILDVYISTTGSDSNDGLTPATPVLNLKRALEVINQQGWNSEVNINFAAGNYDLPPNEPYVFKNTALGSNSGGYVFKGDVQISLGSYSVSNTNNTALAPTSLAMIDPGFLMVPNAYNGRSILFTSGANTGKYYQVAENTTTEIYLLTTDVFVLGDNFTIYQNSTTITTRGNRFTDGYLVMSNVDYILEDRPIINPNEIYSLEIIDTFIIYDNCRILTNPAVVNPYILYYGNTIIGSDNAHIFTDTYISQNLGVVYDGNSITIRMDYINSFVSTSRAYFNKAISNFQNSQAFSFLFYYSNVETIQMFATNAYFGQVVFNNCDSPSNPLLQLDNNGILIIDTGLQLGVTTQLLRCTGSSVMMFNNSLFNLLNVIGTLDGLSALNLNQVTIVNMIGTNPNRTFNDSNIIFNSCNITSPAQIIDFRCCTCVAFNNTTISGDIEFTFNNSSVGFNSFVTNSTTPLTFNNCRIISNNMDFNASVSNLRMSLNQCTCTFDTLNLSEVQLSGYVITSTNSIIGINNLNLINPGTHPLFSFATNNTTISINNFNLNNLAGEFSFQSNNSIIYVGNLTSNTPGTNLNFNLVMSSFNLYGSLNHDGNLSGSPYISLNSNSTARFNVINYNNCQDAFCSIGSACSLLIDNGSVNNCAQFVYKNTQTHNLIQLNNITFSNINTTNNLMDVAGGKVVLTNLNISVSSVGSNYVLNFDNCDIHADTISVDTNIAGCFNLYRTCNLFLNNGTIKASPVSTFEGINMDNSHITLVSSSIDGFNNGVNMIRKSSGLLDNISGSNTTYGLYLFSGSSISHNSANTITGTSSDVLVGTLGNRTWVQINGGLAADTNDYTTPNPAYVFICQI